MYIKAATGEYMLCTDQKITVPASKADEKYYSKVLLRLTDCNTQEIISGMFEI